MDLLDPLGLRDAGGFWESTQYFVEAAWEGTTNAALGMFYDLPVETVGGTYDAVVNYEEPIEGLAYAATHLPETAEAIVDDFVETASTDRGVAKIGGEVIVTILGGGAACKAIKRITKKTKLPKLSNKDVRQWYRDQVKTIDTDLPLTEDNARTVSDQRNKLKQSARDMMTDRDRAKDLDENFPIRDFDHYKEKYSGQGYEGESLWGRIMEGGETTNPDVDRKYDVE